MPADTIGYLSGEEIGQVTAWPYARVLYRAPEPPKPVAVGATIETRAQLEALKPGTHLAGTKAAVGAIRSLNGWLVTGVSNADAHGLVELNLPNWRVVALPEGGAS